MILPVFVGNSRELRMIFDTGMQIKGVLIYNPDLRDSIKLENPIVVTVGGAGSGPAPTALMDDSGSFRTGPMEFHGQKIVVLRNEAMRGFPSDGVIGYSLFEEYAVEIDYDRSLIALRHPDSVKTDKSWTAIPMYFKDNVIPWIDVMVNIEGREDVDLSGYIDLASGDAVELLMREDAKFKTPSGLEPAYLGRGLSGDIHGYKGRITSLGIGPYRLNDVDAAFAPAEVRSKQPGADIVIGNNALRRFNLIFDYKHKHLYLKPNSSFRQPF